MKFEYEDGATPIDKDEAQGLQLSHITTMGELDFWETKNIIEAQKWLTREKPTDILNEDFIKHLHEKMFCDVWKWAGEYRKSDKNIGISWYEVPMDVVKLCEDVDFWMKGGKDSDDLMAVMFHRRLLQVHPFPNGNGRHARLVTDLFLENVLGKPKFTWGSGQSIAKAGDVRKRYISALIKADGFEYDDLISFARS